nr:hypothetical protein GTC16762_03430 [Pigmentibacter ruber]
MKSKIISQITKMLLVILFNNLVYGKEKIEFKIAALQPFQTEDMQDSSIYKNSFEVTLFYILGQFSNELNRCGYNPKISFNYFAHEDVTSLKKEAKNISNDDVWIILGPSKSDQFLNASSVIKATLMLSGMANSKDVFELSWPYFTMYPAASKLAEVTYKTIGINPEFKGKYAIITDITCTYCRDFKTNYEKFAGKPEFEYETDEILFKQNYLVELLKTKQIKSILLSTYSALGGKIVSSLSKTEFNSIKFIANDGFGDALNLGPHYPISENQKVSFIRLGPEKKDTLKIFNMSNLELDWNRKTLYPPDEAIYFKDSMEKIKNFLCLKKPKNKIEFNNLTKNLKRNYFQTQVGYGLFELYNRKITFKELIKN